MLAPDLVRHLKWGVPLAMALAVVAVVAVHVGPGFAVALGAIALGMGLEHYQERRGEGVASVADAAASAAPGVAAGLIYEAWPALASAFTGG
jgi:hypothetical protein